MPRARTWQGLLAAGIFVMLASAASAEPDREIVPAAAQPENASPPAAKRRQAQQPARLPVQPTAASQALAKPDGKPVAPSDANPGAAEPVDTQPTAAPSGETAAVSGRDEPAAAKAQPKVSAEQLTALREESSQLIDEMAQARAKAALLGKTLFKTQLRLRVQNLAAPDPRLLKIELKLDGAPVYVGDGTTLSGDDARQVFEGFIAPGRHVLTASLKQQSREDAAFGYNLHDSYHFKVQRDKLSELTLIVDDDSDMASEYPDDGDGEYDVRLKLRVRTKNIGEE